MKEKEYKKTYKPLILWLILFPLIAIVIPLRFINSSEKILGLALMTISLVAIYLLMLLIYKGEYVYWINGGPSFQEARQAGSEKRREYARAHLDIFLKYTLLGLIYLPVSLILNFSMWIDILFIFMLIVIAALKTAGIKF